MRSWIVIVALLWTAVSAAAEDVRVLVADPYLELRTGPGRGFPVYHVVDRDEWVEVLKRRTDWFKVRASNGKTGWVSRTQMERTLIAAGVPTTFRDTVLEDYLVRRFEVGFAGGAFETDPLMRVQIGWRIDEYFTINAVYGQSSGDFSTTRLMYLALTTTPYPNEKLAPYFSLGAGRFENEPRSTLVSAVNTDGDLLNAGIGLRGYLAERFVLGAEYRQHITLINDNRTDLYGEISAGVAFFF